MVNAILGLLGTILYPLFSIVFLLIQILQNLFYGFAGIGDIYINDSGNGFLGMGTGDKADTGIVYYLFQSDIIKNTLISMTILALFLLVIFTTLAFIKTIYADKPKSWKDIITNSVKGLTNFIVLPVCCLLGVWVGNILLQAINSATSSGGSFYMDRKLFVCCAYNANIYRGDGAFDSSDTSSSEAAYNKISATIEKYACLSDIKVEKGKDSNYYAQIVDEMYSVVNNKGSISIYEQFSVGKYYRLYDINYLFLIVGGIFMMYVLINITYGMIKRMFILLMLFVISPGVCALYPLDEGNAVKSWSGDVKKNIISAYGAVAGMNLFFSIAPIIQTIKIGSNVVAASVTSDIVQLILLICGLFCVNDFISMITGYIGGGNAFADGKSLRGQTQGALKKYGKGTIKGAMNVGGAFVRGAKHGWAATGNKEDGSKGFLRGLGGAALGLGEGFLRMTGRTAGEGLQTTYNAVNKAGADTLGLQSKDMHGKDFLPQNIKKYWENSGFGQLQKENMDAKRKKADEAATKADEAATKANKDAFKKKFEDSADKKGAKTSGEWHNIFDAAGDFKTTTAAVDSSDPELKTFDSALLKSLSESENAGFSTEDYVKLLSKNSGKSTTEINEQIKKEQAGKAEVGKYNDAVKEKRIQDAVGGGKTPETSLSDESITNLTKELKDAMSQIFNSQSNTGTAAAGPFTGNGGGNNEPVAPREMMQQLQEMSTNIIAALGKLESEVRTTGNETKTKYGAENDKLITEINNLKSALKDNQTSSGLDNQKAAEIIALLTQILDNLK